MLSENENCQRRRSSTDKNRNSLGERESQVTPRSVNQKGAGVTQTLSLGDEKVRSSENPRKGDSTIIQEKPPKGRHYASLRGGGRTG